MNHEIRWNQRFSRKKHDMECTTDPGARRVWPLSRSARHSGYLLTMS
jgi:hypothetical protein